MSKWYQVKVTSVRMMLVEVDETLANVIECLRADARFVDEEGEATDRLQDLLDALRTPGVRVPQAPSITDEEIDAIATRAYRAGRLPWLGFKKDADGRYTIPLVNEAERALIRECIASFRPCIQPKQPC